MNEMGIAVLTATLKRLDIPYAVQGDTLTINTTSTAMLMILPGKLVNSIDGDLELNIKEFDLVEWIANTIQTKL